MKSKLWKKKKKQENGREISMGGSEFSESKLRLKVGLVYTE